MPSRLQWTPDLSVGNDVLDAQHRILLERCDALADCLAESGPEGGSRFRERFAELMALCREHYAVEEALLAACGYPELEAHRNERDEFDYLAAEIVTAENFDRQELSSFLSLWWTGHILGSAAKQRAFLQRQPAA
jgi:hemerythrin